MPLLSNIALTDGGTKSSGRRVGGKKANMGVKPPSYDNSASGSGRIVKRDRDAGKVVGTGSNEYVAGSAGNMVGSRARAVGDAAGPRSGSVGRAIQALTRPYVAGSAMNPIGSRAERMPEETPRSKITSAILGGTAASPSTLKEFDPEDAVEGAPDGGDFTILPREQLGAKAADESSYYDTDGVVAEAGDSDSIDLINQAMQEALENSEVFSDVDLDEIEGYDPANFTYDLVFHGNADVNPFGIVYGTETWYDPSTGDEYLVLSDAADKAREEFLYSLYSSPELADAFGEYAGISREDFAKMYAEAQSFLQNVEDMADTGYQMWGGDDQALRAAAQLLVANQQIPFVDEEGNYDIIDLYEDEDGNYDQELAINNMEAYLANELMRSATADLWEDGMLSGDASATAASRLGWRQDDLNNLMDNENIRYQAGTNEGVNTSAHRGDWTLDDGYADEDWLARTSETNWGNSGSYGGNYALPVVNQADNVFSIYTGMGYTG